MQGVTKSLGFWTSIKDSISPVDLPVVVLINIIVSQQLTQ